MIVEDFWLSTDIMRQHQTRAFFYLLRMQSKKICVHLAN